MATKTQASQSDSQKKSTTATTSKHEKNPEEWTQSDTVTVPTDESHQALLAEQADLDKPGRVSKSDAEFIDSDPGYSKNQLAHMREYYGISEQDNAADVAPV